MMTIAKIDAHHHLWTLGSAHYPALAAQPVKRFYGDSAGLRHMFGGAEFAALAASQNVIASVYVESHFHPPEEETGAVDAIADRHGFPQAIVGRVDPRAPELENVLAGHMHSPRFRGVRLMVNWDADALYRSAPCDGLLRDPDWRRGYAIIGDRGLSCEVMAMPAQLGDLAELAAATPGTPLIVGHCGLPARRSTGEDEAWRRGLGALAELPHVAVKISGLGMVDHHWSVESIRPIVLEVVNLFGADRCMFASNFPVDGLHASYDRIWDAFDEATAELSDGARHALFRETARRVYRIA